MSKLSFRHSTITEFFYELPGYADFTIESALDPKTYRYGVVLRLEFAHRNSRLDHLTERQCDEAVCEMLGYGHPSRGEPLPAAYRALKSRAHKFRDGWITSHFAPKQPQHATVGGYHAKTA